MAWRDDIIQGSLNGVKFFYTEEDNTGTGRKQEVYESPREDGSDFVDFARGTRRFNLSCYLIGENYQIDQERLREVTDSPGPYLFEHPLIKGFRQIYVICETAPSFKTSIEEGGMVRFSLQLLEVRAPKKLAPTSPAPGEFAKSAIKIQKSAFAKSFAPPKGSFLNGVFSALRRITSTLAALNGGISSQLNKVNLVAAYIDNFNRQIGVLINTPTALASAIANLMGAIFGLFRGFDSLVEYATEPGIVPPPIPVAYSLVLSSASTMIADSFEEFKATPKESEGSSQAKTQQEASINQISVLYKVVALSESGFFLAGPDTQFETAQEAQEARDEWMRMVDGILFSGELDPFAFAPLMNLRTEVYNYLTNLSYTLPRLVLYTPVRTVPAMVLAYELYGDSNRATEIVRRNKIKNPMIVQGGKPIEVLSYDL